MKNQTNTFMGYFNAYTDIIVISDLAVYSKLYGESQEDFFNRVEDDFFLDFGETLKIVEHFDNQ